MSSNNQTNTNHILISSNISERNYIKKLRIRTQNYSIATVLFFISGLGLNSFDDFKKPNNFKKILNYTKPLVIFLSMPFGILTAINCIKLISAKDLPKFYNNKSNIINYYQTHNSSLPTPNYPSNDVKTNPKQISLQSPSSADNLSISSKPKPVIRNAKFKSLITHPIIRNNSP